MELEWLQFRVEYDADLVEDRCRIKEQCIKLHAVNSAAEVVSVKQYPQPQIMISKLQVAAKGSCDELSLGQKFLIIIMHLSNIEEYALK